MNAWLMLLRREWWEHRGGFGWTPLGIAGAGLFFAFYALAMAGGADFRIDFQAEIASGADSRSIDWSDTLLGLLDLTRWSTGQLDAALANLRRLIAQPFVWAHFLVALFVLPAMLNDDRRDRSVLFWKALPVSDFATVSSKLVFVVCVAPLVTTVAILVTWIGVLALVSLFTGGEGLATLARLWSHAGLVSGALGLLLGFAIQGLWTLPVYAWLLCVSAAVPRAPLVWAALAPLIAATLERMFIGSNVLWSWCASHLAFVAMPDSRALAERSATGQAGLTEQLALLASIDLWVGVAIGALLLYGATWFRARSFDI
jgi:ABC-2 type transport system permease protein